VGFYYFERGFMKKLLVCISLGLSISSAMASLHGREDIGNKNVNRGGGNDPTARGITGGKRYYLFEGDGSGGGKTSGGNGSGGPSLNGGDMGGGGIKYRGYIK
jgi:hypothetical protein